MNKTDTADRLKWLIDTYCGKCEIRNIQTRPGYKSCAVELRILKPGTKCLKESMEEKSDERTDD